MSRLHRIFNAVAFQRSNDSLSKDNRRKLHGFAVQAVSIRCGTTVTIKRGLQLLLERVEGDTRLNLQLRYCKGIVVRREFPPKPRCNRSKRSICRVQTVHSGVLRLRALMAGGLIMWPQLDRMSLRRHLPTSMTSVIDHATRSGKHRAFALLRTHSSRKLGETLEIDG